MSGFPPRDNDNAISGSQFMARVKATLGDVHAISAEELATRRARVEEMVLEQVMSGNVPDFMRPENWRTVSVEVKQGERRIAARVRVCPDYLSIGSNTDFVRVPINPLTAQRIADACELSMPTARLVDIIDAEAKHTKTTNADGEERTGMLPFVAAPSIAQRVTDPATGQPVSKRWNNKKYGQYEGRWMMSAEFMGMQSQMIDENASAAGNPPFISGIKKDIVYDNLALGEATEGGRPVVIYRPGVQPLSSFHNELYSDYSHGVRFVGSEVRVRVTEADGSVHEEDMSMRDLLRHKDYHRVFAPSTMDIGEMYRPRTRSARATPRRTEARELPARVEDADNERRIAHTA